MPSGPLTRLPCVSSKNKGVTRDPCMRSNDQHCRLCHVLAAGVEPTVVLMDSRFAQCRQRLTNRLPTSVHNRGVPPYGHPGLQRRCAKAVAKWRPVWCGFPVMPCPVTASAHAGGGQSSSPDFRVLARNFDNKGEASRNASAAVVATAVGIQLLDNPVEHQLAAPYFFS
jgi:hypothetical protein